MDPAPEPWIERRIREAVEAGDLVPTTGLGEPLPDLDRPYDPTWWVRRWVQREGLGETLRNDPSSETRRIPGRPRRPARDPEG